MPMNPVLEYAVDHRAEACGLLVSRYQVPLDDTEDIVQAAMLRVLQANPDDRSPRAYWLAVVRTTFFDYWRHRRVRRTWPFAYGEDGTLLTDPEDPHQDCERQAEALETVRETWERATLTERESMVVAMTEPVRCLPDRTKQGLARLRRRLRAAVASPL